MMVNEIVHPRLPREVRTRWRGRLVKRG